jgi:TP901 family phage tail tape measure protein
VALGGSTTSLLFLFEGADAGMLGLLQLAGTGLGKVASAADAANARFAALNEVGKGVATFGLALGGALAFVGDKALGAAEQYQSAMTDIQNATGQSDAQIKQLGDSMLGTAGKTEFSANEQAAAYAKVAGQLLIVNKGALDTAQAMAFMTTASKLAVATNSDLASTTQAVTSVLKSYGLGLDQAGKAADVLYNASSRTGLGVSDIATRIDILTGRLGPLSPSLAEVTTLFTALTNAGLNNRLAISAATQSYTYLLDKQKDVAPATAALQAQIDALNKSYQAGGGESQKFANQQADLAQKQARLTQQYENGQITYKAYENGLYSISVAQEKLDRTMSQSSVAATQKYHAELDKLNAKMQEVVAKGLGPAEEEAKKLGITMFDASGHFLGMEAVIGQLQPHLAALKDTTAASAEQQRLWIEKALFGQNAGLELDKVIMAGAEAYQTQAEAIDKNGTTQDAAARKAADLKNQIATLKAALSDISTTLGTALIPMVNQLVQAVLPVVSSIADWITNHRELAGTIFLSLAGLAGFSLAVGGLMLLVEPVFKLVKGIGGAIEGLGSLGGKLAGLFRGDAGAGLVAQGQTRLAASVERTTAAVSAYNTALSRSVVSAAEVEATSQAVTAAYAEQQAALEALITLEGRKKAMSDLAAVSMSEEAAATQAQTDAYIEGATAQDAYMAGEEGVAAGQDGVAASTDAAVVSQEGYSAALEENTAFLAGQAGATDAAVASTDAYAASLDASTLSSQAAAAASAEVGAGLDTEAAAIAPVIVGQEGLGVATAETAATSEAGALRMAAAWVGAKVQAVAAFIEMSAQAVLNAGRAAAAWVAQMPRAIGALLGLRGAEQVTAAAAGEVAVAQEAGAARSAGAWLSNIPKAIASLLGLNAAQAEAATAAATASASQVASAETSAAASVEAGATKVTSAETTAAAITTASGTEVAAYEASATAAEVSAAQQIAANQAVNASAVESAAIRDSAGAAGAVGGLAGGAAPAAEKAGVGLLSWVPKLGTLLAGIPLAIAGFFGLAGAETAAGAAAAPAAAGIGAVALPVLAVVAAVALLVGGIVLLVTHWQQVHAFLQQHIPVLAQAADALGNFFQHFGPLQGAIATVRGALSGLGEAWSNLTKGLESALSGPWKQLQPILAEFGSSLQELLGVVSSTLGSLMDALGTIASAIWPPLQVLLEAVGAVVAILVGGPLAGAVGALVGFFKSAIPVAIQALIDSLHVLADTFRLVVDAIRDMVSLIGDFLSGNWSKLGDDLQRLFGDMGRDIIGLVQDWASGVVHIVQGLGTILLSTVQGFLTGIADFFEWGAKQIGLKFGINQAVAGPLKAALDWVGQNWPLIVSLLGGPLGLAVVLITGHGQKLLEAVRGPAQAVLSFVSSAWSGLSKLLASPFEAAGQAISGAMNGMLGSFVKAAEGVLGVVAKIPGPVGDSARLMLGALQSLAGGSQQSSQQVQAALGGLAQSTSQAKQAMVQQLYEMQVQTVDRYEAMRQAIVAQIQQTTDPVQKAALEQKLAVISNAQEAALAGAQAAYNLRDSVVQAHSQMKTATLEQAAQMHLQLANEYRVMAVDLAAEAQKTTDPVEKAALEQRLYVVGQAAEQEVEAARAAENQATAVIASHERMKTASIAWAQGLLEWVRVNWPHIFDLYTAPMAALAGAFGLSRYWQQIHDLFVRSGNGILDWVRVNWSGLFNLLTAPFQQMLSWMTKLPGPLGDSARQALSALQAIGGGSQQAAQQVGSAAGSIGNALGQMSQAAAQARADYLDQLSQMSSGAASQFGTMREQILAQLAQTTDPVEQAALEEKLTLVSQAQDAANQVAAISADLAVKVPSDYQAMKTGTLAQAQQMHADLAAEYGQLASAIEQEMAGVTDPVQRAALQQRLDVVNAAQQTEAQASTAAQQTADNVSGSIASMSDRASGSAQAMADSVSGSTASMSDRASGSAAQMNQNVTSQSTAAADNVQSTWGGLDLSGISNWFGQLGGQIGGFFQSLGGGAEQAGPQIGNFFSGLGGQANDLLGQLATLPQKFGDLFDGLGSDVSQGINQLQAKLATLPALAGQIGTLAGQILEGVVGNTVGALVNALPGKVGQLFDELGTDVSSALNRLGPKLQAAGDVIGSQVGAFFSQLGTNLSGLPAQLQTIPQKVGDLFSGLGADVSHALGVIGPQIGNFFDALGTQTHGLVSQLESLPQKVGDLFDGLGTDVHGALDRLGSNLKHTLDVLGPQIGGFFDQLGTNAKHAGDVVGAQVGAFFSQLGSNLSGLPDQLKSLPQKIGDLFSGLGADMSGRGRDLVQGFLNGVGQALSGLGTWIHDNFVSKWNDFVKNQWGITSPSTVMAAIGEDVARGFLLGIQNVWDGIGAWIQSNLIDPFLNALKADLGIASPSTVMASLGVDAAQGFLNGMASLFDGLPNWLQSHVSNPIGGFFSGLGKQAREFVGPAPAGSNSAQESAAEWQDQIDTWHRVEHNLGIIWDSIHQKWSDFQGVLEGIPSWLTGHVLEPLKSFGSELSKQWGEFWGPPKAGSKAAQEDAAFWQDQIDTWHRVEHNAGLIFAAIGQHWSELWSGLQNFKLPDLKSAWASISSEIAKWPGQIGQLGKDVGQGFLEGVGGAFSALGTWVQAHLFQPFLSAIKGLFGIASPSTVMASLGVDIAQGLLNGLLSVFDGLPGWLQQHLLEPITNAIKGFKLPDVSGLFKGLFGGGGQPANPLANFKLPDLSGMINQAEKAEASIRQHLGGIQHAFQDFKLPELKLPAIKLPDTSAILGALGQLKSGIQQQVAAIGAEFQRLGQAFQVGGLKSALQTFWADEVAGWKNTWQQIQGLTAQAGSALRGQLSNALNALSGLAESFWAREIAGWQRIWGVIGQATGSAWAAIRGLLNTIWGAIDSLAQAIWSRLPQRIQAPMEALWARLGAGWSQLEGLLAALWQRLEASAGARFESLRARISASAAAAWQFLQSVWSLANNFLVGVWNNVQNSAAAAWNRFAQIVEGGLNRSLGAVYNIGGAIRNVLGGLANQAWSWGANLIQGFINGIMAKVPAVRNAAATVASAVRRVIGFFSPPAEGPAADSDQWAPNLVRMLAEGLAAGDSSLKSAASRLASVLSASLGGLQLGAPQVGGLNADALSRGLSSLVASLAASRTQLLAELQKISEAIAFFRNSLNVIGAVDAAGGAAKILGFKTSDIVAVTGILDKIRDAVLFFRNSLSVVGPVNAAGGALKILGLSSDQVSQVTAVLNSIQGGVQKFQSFLAGAWQQIESTAAAAWARIPAQIRAPLEALWARLEAGWNQLRGFLGGLWPQIEQSAQAAFNGLVGAIESGLSRGLNAARGFGSQIAGVFTPLPGQAATWGANLIQGFVNGLNSRLNQLRSAAANAANAVKRFLGFSSPAEEGPGSSADQWGPRLVEMLAAGLSAGQNQIRAAVQSLAQIISQGLSQLNLGQLQVSGLTAALSAVGSALTNLGAAASNFRSVWLGTLEALKAGMPPVMAALGALLDLGRSLGLSAPQAQALADRLSPLARGADEVLARFKSLAGGSAELLVGALKTLHERIADVVSILGGTKEALQAGVAPALAILGALLNLGRAFALSAQQAQVFSNLLSPLANRVDALGAELRKLFAQVATEARSWGQNLVGGLINGINDKLGGLRSALGNAAQQVSNFLGFHSPTEEGPGAQAETWMPNLIALLVRGLQGGQASLGAAASQLISLIAKALQGPQSLNLGLGQLLRPNTPLGQSPAPAAPSQDSWERLLGGLEQSLSQLAQAVSVSLSGLARLQPSSLGVALPALASGPLAQIPLPGFSPAASARPPSPSGASARGGITVENLTIHNPIAEPASTTLHRELRKLAYSPV